MSTVTSASVLTKTQSMPALLDSRGDLTLSEFLALFQITAHPVVCCIHAPWKVVAASGTLALHKDFSFLRGGFYEVRL